MGQALLKDPQSPAQKMLTNCTTARWEHWSQRLSSSSPQTHQTNVRLSVFSRRGDRPPILHAAPCALSEGGSWGVLRRGCRHPWAGQRGREGAPRRGRTCRGLFWDRAALLQLSFPPAEPPRPQIAPVRRWLPTSACLFIQKRQLKLSINIVSSVSEDVIE